MQSYSWNGSYSFPWERYGKLRGSIVEYLGDSNRIIDIGFREGKLLDNLRESYPGKELTGLEIISLPLKTGFYNICGSIESAPFQRGSFDGLLCTFVLDYLSREARQNAINEIRRIVKKDGKVVFCFHSRKSGILEAMVRDATEARIEGKMGEVRDIVYVAKALNANIFPDERRFMDYMKKIMFAEELDVIQGEENGKIRETGYVAFLRNREPE